MLSGPRITPRYKPARGADPAATPTASRGFFRRRKPMRRTWRNPTKARIWSFVARRPRGDGFCLKRGAKAVYETFTAG